MNEKAKQALVAQVVQIATNATKNSSVTGTERRSKMLGAKGFTFRLVNDIVDLYEDVCRQLLKRQDWGSKFSEKYIDSKLHKVLAELLENDDMSKAPEYVDKLISELENFSDEQLVLLPLTGVFVNDIGGQFRIRIGARDSFECATDNQIWGPSDNEKGNHLTFC